MPKDQKQEPTGILHQKIKEFLELYIIKHKMLDEDVDIIPRVMYEGANQFRISRNGSSMEAYQFINIKYSELMCITEFSLREDLDSKMIEKLKEYCVTDELHFDMEDKGVGNYKFTFILSGHDVFEDFERVFSDIYASLDV